MEWFGNLKIKVKIVACCMVIALFTGIVGIIGISNMSTINNRAEDMYKNNFLPSQELAKIPKNLQMIRVDYFLMLYEKDMNKFEERLNEINRLSEEDSRILSNYESTAVHSEEERNLFNHMKMSLNTYRDIRTEHINMMRAGKFAEVQVKVPELANARVQAEEDVQKMIDFNIKFAQIEANKNAAEFTTQSILMVIISIIGVGLAIFLALIIANIISKPLIQLVRVADQIAEGDFDVTIDVDTKDEVGMLAESFRIMTEKMNDVMTNINASAEQVASGARQVSASGQILSQGSTEQASSIEEITASLEEIAAQTKQNATNANQANELAILAKENAVQGNIQMNEMLKSMEEINDSSANISKIIKVIDEIAFQTNILALNAAVEAARAGQHGKGFAVVAEEVRNLAARSANAAKETTTMIEGSIKKVELGTKIANETAAALSDIVEGVAKATSLVGEIAAASNEQATGVAQVNQAIMQVSQVVQTNSATAEESASASEELSSQAVLLKDMVGKFNLKKANSSFNHLEGINLDVIKMLEDMAEKKKINSVNNINDGIEEAAASKLRISLSDKEFGKY